MTYDSPSLSKAFKCMSLDDANCHYGYVYIQNDNTSEAINEIVVFTEL